MDEHKGTNPAVDSLFELKYDTSKQTYEISSTYFGNTNNSYYNNPYNDVNMLNYWGNDFVFSKKAVTEVWNDWVRKSNGNNHKNPIVNTNVVAAEEPPEIVKELFEKNFMEFIKANKNIKLYVFFPPFSIIHLKTHPQDMALRKYVVANLNSCKNVKIFDFQDIAMIVANLDNYKDPLHYSPKINEYIIDSMEANEHLLTEKNLNTRLLNLKRLSGSFDLESLSMRGDFAASAVSSH